MEQFQCISIDYPWPERGGGRIKRGADRHYSLCKAEDAKEIICGSGVWRLLGDQQLLAPRTSDRQRAWVRLQDAHHLGKAHLRHRAVPSGARPSTCSSPSGAKGSNFAGSTLTGGVHRRFCTPTGIATDEARSSIVPNPTGLTN